MRPASRDLVLGLIHGYPTAMVQPFLDTLRTCAPWAQVILATSEITPKTEAELRGLGCQLLPYRYLRTRLAGRKIWLGNSRLRRFHERYAAWINALPGISAATKLSLRAHVARHFLDPNTRRFVEFHLALRRELPNFDRVLISDLRDVVFQADPFALVRGNGIFYGQEDHSLKIGSQWANSLWLERVVGQHIRDELAEERISCVGVVVGSGRSIAEYLRKLVDTLTQPGINVANFHGADTGAHNFVVRRGGIANARFGDFKLGGILNMHGLAQDCIRWNSDDLLVDAEGRPFAIVHQYDRHPAVAERLLRRLGTSVAQHASTDRFFSHT